MVIIFSKNGKNATRIESSRIESEGYLQDYLFKNPDIIPAYDIDVGARLLVLTREFKIPAGSIDAIGIDQNGRVYIIETKLYKNPDKRKVVAQVLDYGASLWKNYHFERFLIDLENQIRKHSAETLKEKIQKFFDIDEHGANDLIDSMGRNIQEGVFKFVVLMDKLHNDLKNLILFINQNSEFDIYAVEIEYYKHEENEIIIPKLFGEEVRKSPRQATERSVYDEDYHLNKVDESVQIIYKKLKKDTMKMGNNIDIVSTKIYIAFRKNNHFVYIKLMKSFLYVLLSLNKGELDDPDNLAEDVSDKGTHGYGDYKLKITSVDDVPKYIPLVKQAYIKN